MTSSLLVGVLSAVLANAGSQTSSPTPQTAANAPAQAATGAATRQSASAPSQAASGTTSAQVAHAGPSGFALTLPKGTLCFGKPRGVHCDRYWPTAPDPTPAPSTASTSTASTSTASSVAGGNTGSDAKKSWHFTILDKTFCVGDTPPGVHCTVRFDRGKSAP
jgi:hypothetical protein